VRRFFQIRNNDKAVDQRLYSVSGRPTAVSVKRHPSGRKARMSLVLRAIDLVILENAWCPKDAGTIPQMSAPLTDE
jgi:hypothetical protein